MKHRLYFLIFLLTSVFVHAQEQKMSVQEINEFKSLAEQTSKSLKSLKADFVQYRHLDILAKDVESTGKMYFKQPNVLHWQYLKPNPYSIAFKNEKVFINDNGKKSVADAKSKMFGKINALMVSSVNGKMFDDKEFTITYFKDKQHYIAILVPKAKQLKKIIHQVNLYFSLNDAGVNQIKMIEPSGDYTLVLLKNKQINLKLEDSSFNN